MPGLVLVNKATTDGRVKDVDRGGCELARTDAAFEEEVELGKGAASWLGDAKVGVDDAEEAYTGLCKWNVG